MNASIAPLYFHETILFGVAVLRARSASLQLPVLRLGSCCSTADIHTRVKALCQKRPLGTLPRAEEQVLLVSRLHHQKWYLLSQWGSVLDLLFNFKLVDRTHSG